MAEGIVDKATSAIVAADLTPIEHQILVGFIKEAEAPDLAAREVLDRIRDGDDERPVEEILRILKKDWYELVAVGAHPHPPTQVYASTEPLLVSRSTPVDASLRVLVDRRDQSRCCVTPPERRQLDAPEPTFVFPPALSELRGDDGAKVLCLFLQTVLFNAEALR